jgi:hypothetical protein
MQNYLKNNVEKVLVAVLVLSGCTSPSYFRIDKEFNYKTEVKVTPDRVIVNCEDVIGDKSYFALFIYVLDEENSVSSISRFSPNDEQGCQEIKDKIDRIVMEGKEIYIGGMGSLNEPRQQGSRKYFFKGHGTYYLNKREIQFMVIANEKGRCFSFANGDDPPCPPEPFPI